MKTEIIDVLRTHLDAHENTLVEDARFKGETYRMRRAIRRFLTLEYLQ